MRNLHSLLIVAAVMAAGCSSCFTGIESTPRITREDVRRSGVKVSAEQLFADSISGQSPHEWLPGKQWQVSDDKIAIIFSGTPESASNLSGQNITLVDRTTASTVTGEEVVELRLNTPNGNTLIYRTDIPANEWDKRQSLSIPFTVELDPVAKADSMLRGRTLYITTPLWYDNNGNLINGLRHIPVRINRVIPGSANYPLCVAFTPLEGDSAERFILMTYGNSPSATRNFDRLFAFEDPRLRYKQISDEMWQNITRSQLSVGMSRDEARLAAGTPASISRYVSRGSMQMERWSYEDGVYLIFEEGVLVQYRR